MSFNSLSDLRKARGSFDNLMKEVEKIDAPQSNYKKDDGNEWKLSVDSAGNGYAVLRFLPAPKGEELPWVRMFNHGFQGPTGKWYIENSLTTLNQQDPVSELNSELWNSGTLMLIKIWLVSKSVDFLITQMFLLLKILPTLRMRDRLCFTSSVRKSLTKSKTLCNLSSRMRHQ